MNAPARPAWAHGSTCQRAIHASATKTATNASQRNLAIGLVLDHRVHPGSSYVTPSPTQLSSALMHFTLILDELQRLGVSLICSSQGIDTSGDNPAGRLQLGVLMAVAEFERSLIWERVNAGLRAAKGRDVKLGRPSTPADRREEVLQLKVQGLGLRAAAACRASGPTTTR